jgi:2-dehydro-3-deoxyphosphooctonate aldolase (KDO 8-P synthase)
MMPTAAAFKAAITNKQFFLLAGPCAIESEQIVRKVAIEIKAIADDLGLFYVLKGSYKKANRTRADSFTGIGDQVALEILQGIGKELGIPTVTDIHSPEEASMAAEYADVLQIPAFLSRQTELLVAAGKTGKWVNIKKGQFMAPDAMAHAAAKVAPENEGRVMLTDRGTFFGYQDLVVDFRSIPLMALTGFPTVMDCTHSLQQPNQQSGVTGGQPQLIETIARAAIAVGADGLFIETHPDPANALSDGANMLNLIAMRPLLTRLSILRATVNSFENSL